MAALPSCILLKSCTTNKYLRYGKQDGVAHLRFTQDEEDDKVELRCVKFEVEKADVGEGLVHIRTCYNNKYLTRKSIESNYLVAEANEKEEDQSKWCSTLFKPIFIDGGDGATTTFPRKIQLVHMDHLGQHSAGVSKAFDLLSSKIQQDANSDDDVFMVYDGEDVVNLPDYLVFNTSVNCYCRTVYIGRIEIFTQDFAEEGVCTALIQFPLKQLLTLHAGYLQDKLNWLNDPDIHNAIVSYLEPASSFTPVVLDKKVIALRCAANNLYVQVVKPGSYPYELRATSSAIEDSTKLYLSEPVFNRNVTNVVFDLDNSRIYDVGSVDKWYDSFTNGSDAEQISTMTLSYKRTRTKSWNDGLSVSIGIKASVTAGIPLAVEEGIEISASVSESVEWGAEVKEEESFEKEYTITVPPWTKTTFTVVASRAKCDVPYSCRVSDTMTDGNIRTYTNSGLFVGANEYDFIAKLKAEPLSRTTVDQQ